MANPMVKIDNLSKKYRLGMVHSNLLSEKIGGVLKWLVGRGTGNPKLPGEDYWALRNVSFEVQPGEVVGIIGRNGAGKSTLLKILSRITAPTEGSVELFGRVASLLEVGTGFHPELTGRENVYLNGAILGMGRAEIRRKFDEIIAFAEVDRFVDTPVKRYSSGMYVRLAFAVAAHLEPEILMVDEVLAVGDTAFQKKCLGKMEDAAGGGRTVFFVSHNMANIKMLSSSVAYLRNGSLVDKGTPADMIASYLKDNFQADAASRIPDEMHRKKSHIQVQKIEILDWRGQPGFLMRFGKDIIVRLSVRASSPEKSVRLGIGVYAEGIRLSTLHTPPVSFVGNSEQTVSCKIRGGVLKPNFFSIHVGAHSLATGRGLDWVTDAASFQVAEMNSSEFDPYEKGLVRLDAEWEVDLSPKNRTGKIFV